MAGTKVLVRQPPLGLRARRLVVVAKATTSQRSPRSVAPSERSKLHDPASIGASLSTSTSVQDRGGDRALGKYMSLPVDKFALLDPELIHQLGKGNRFLLSVPRINLLSVWLEPLVEVEVVASLGRVSILSTGCRLRGSELLQRLRLDERVAIEFATHLTWADGVPPAGAFLNGNGSGIRTATYAGADSAEDGSWQNGARELAGRLTRPFAGLGGGGGDTPDIGGKIHAVSEVTVWSEVVPPFNLMPREALQAAGNTVLAGVMRTLLPLFLRRLADDYEKWASDNGYWRSRMP
ncbi:hypothetical protein WJX81_000572 [Elliptochloris bilobata]|uniref:Uncharacterized protein n=1 Tax=Elliptochloris bilobata TaxID=381761 RepID=A0AAW1QN93_9CHLO